MFASRFHISRKRVWSWFLNYWPVVVLAFLSLSLFVTNYFPGTYLIGWDNTVPELNTSLNLKRFLFGVWQDYRGLGTLDGMAHTANIVYWFYTTLLSIFLPTPLIRYVTQLGCHFLGGAGVYFLSRYLNRRLFPHSQILAQQSVSLLAAVLYMLNLMTVQMFYIPLELFSLHFVALPWLFVSLFRFFDKPSAKAFLFFILVCFLTASQAHVPTLFIVTGIAVGLLFTSYLLFSFSWKKLRTVLLCGVGFICINAWWAAPYAYSAIVKPAEISQSRINLFSTNDIFYRNQAFGDLGSVLRFGSFNVDYLDWETQTIEFVPILKAWQSHYFSSAIATVNIVLSVIGILGLLFLVIIGLTKRKPFFFAVGLIGLFAFSMLATDTPGISLVSYILREKVPLFKEVFRFTFTKFSFLYVCCLSIGFGAILLWVIQPITKLSRTFLLAGIFGFLGGALLFISVPAFQGNFFYPELRHPIPEDYFSLQKFFNQKPANTRIAVFPLHGFYGWTTNTWGHRGSGFLWQMLPQPMLDRAFDAWSRDNETFYNQVRAAVVYNDPEMLKKTLEKYRVQWILFDQTLFQPGENVEALRLSQLPDLFSRAGITEETRFGDLIVFKANDLNLDPFLASPTPIQAPYSTSYTTTDQAFLDYSNYTVEQTGVSFPFSFFQASSLKDPKTFSVEGHDLITNFNLKENQKFEVPRYADTQESAVVDLYSQVRDSSLFIRFSPQLPKVDDQQTSSEINLELEIPLSEVHSRYFLVIDNHVFTVDPTTDLTFLSRTVLPTKKNFSVNLYDGIPAESADMLQAYRRVPVRDCWKDTSQRWTVGEDQGDTIALYSLNASACVSLDISGNATPTLANEIKQLLIVETTSVSPSDNIPAHCVHEKTGYRCLNDTLSSVRDSQNKTTFQTYTELEANTPYGLDIINRVRQVDKEEKVDYQTIQLKTYNLLREQPISLAAKVEEASSQLNQQFNQLPTGQFKLRIPSLHLSFAPTSKVEQNPITQRFERVPSLNCDIQKRGVISREENDKLVYSATQKAALCESFMLSGIPNEAEYLYHVQGFAENGSGLRGNIFNPSDSTQELEFSSGIGNFNLWLPLEISQSITEIDEPLRAHFTVQSYGQEKNTISLQEASLYPLPLEWLRQLKTVPSQSLITEVQGVLSAQRQIGNFWYSANVNTQNVNRVVLPQSYEAGWIGILQEKGKLSLLSQHQPTNGWANSWLIPITTEAKIYLVYLPQLVSFVGWVVTGLTFAVVTTSTLRARKKKYIHSHEASSQTSSQSSD